MAITWRHEPPATNFTRVHNALIRNPLMPALSFKLLVQMMSHRRDHDFKIEQMMRDCIEGERAIRTALKWLETNGYLKSTRQRRGQRLGGYDWEVTIDGSGEPLGEATEPLKTALKPAQRSVDVTRENVEDPQVSSTLRCEGFTTQGHKKTNLKKTVSKKTENSPPPPSTVTHPPVIAEVGGGEEISKDKDKDKSITDELTATAMDVQQIRPRWRLEDIATAMAVAMSDGYTSTAVIAAMMKAANDPGTIVPKRINEPRWWSSEMPAATMVKPTIVMCDLPGHGTHRPGSGPCRTDALTLAEDAPARHLHLVA